jgi:hypothetical protein
MEIENSGTLVRGYLLAWERVRKKSVGFGNSALVLGVYLDPVKGVF